MSAAPSLTEAVEPIEAGAHAIHAAWLGDRAAFALADGAVLLAGKGEPVRVPAHPEGAVLAAAADARRLVTGGDDGAVVEVTADGRARPLREAGGAWIDAVALHPGGTVAWSAGRKVVVRDEKGRERTLDAPSTARGLAFAPKGTRLAVSHYNGVTLWFPNLDTPPEFLEWKGSHIDVAWSPDGRFVVSSMQENALHGWRLLPDRAHMRMTGYPAKTRSLSWSHDEAWLATSGAEAAILWPFGSREGPMGKAPRECGVRPARVTQVACHPKALVLAAGYEDGCILLVRLTDNSELMLRRPTDKADAVTALAWDRAGRRLLFGTAGGAAGLATLPA